jgi:hypothetical protein
MRENQIPTSEVACNGNPRHVDDLDMSPADDGYIIYQPDKDRVHFLNPSAVLILELCDGENSPEQIVDLVKQAYGLPDAPVKEVHEALKQLKADCLLL